MNRFLMTLLFLLPFHVAGEAMSLEGAYWIDGKVLIDAPDGQKNDTHMYFRLEGKAAEDLYNLIESEPKWDECGVDHWEKRNDKLSCEFYEKEKAYYCYFSIDIHSEELFYGPPC